MSYEIRVRGHLGKRLRCAFSDLDVRVCGGDTVMSGALDQAALHGVLSQIEALVLEIIEVRRCDDAD